MQMSNKEKKCFLEGLSLYAIVFLLNLAILKYKVITFETKDCKTWKLGLKAV